MLGKDRCYVSDLTTEYNKAKTGKAISDFTIRYWLDRLNEIGYVEKREDPQDKRKNIYIPLVKKKQELRENTLNPENHINLATVLKNSFEKWKTNIRKVGIQYYKNIFEDNPVTLEEIEPSILGAEKIISVFDTDLFKYPDKAKEEQEQEKEPKSPLNQEIKTNSNNKQTIIEVYEVLRNNLKEAFYQEKAIDLIIQQRKCNQKEAEQLFQLFVNEGKLFRDVYGLWMWNK
jgi:DNA-binding PadR family transcriptional regulator